MSISSQILKLEHTRTYKYLLKRNFIFTHLDKTTYT